MIQFKDTLAQWAVILPKLQTVRKKFRNDENLIRQVEVLINKAEPKLAQNNAISEDVMRLHAVLSAETYYQHRRDLRGEEEVLLREIANDLELMIRFAKKEENLREETSPVVEKKRFPNSETKDIFELSKTSTERLI